MAGGVIYLDIDDEITSAASRIRSVEGIRVGVVLPYGSRVATSRINLRLLARDALTHQKRLSVIGGDATTRALAASAGLPVFASVQEYESALEDEAAADAEAAAKAPAGAAKAPAGATRTVAAPAPPNEAAARRATSKARTAPPAAATTATTAATAAAADAVVTGATTRTMRATPVPAQPPAAGRTDEARVRPTSATRPASVGGGGPRIPRTPFLVAAVVLGLAVVVAGVGAFLLLPSAEIVLTPREQTIGPLAFRVDASTEITEPDLLGGVVPALTIPVEVQAADTFEASGERVEETAARGTVRFDNLDPTSSNTIAKGATVSTNGGTRFRTDRAITIAAAKLVGFTIIPSSALVAVTAVSPGTEGNVQPNAITTEPKGEEPLFLDVTNPDETSGGKRDTFPRVTQADVDAALETLTTTLTTDFQARVDASDLAPVDVTAFPETATMGDPVWSVDPETFVGTEVERFDLGGTVGGTVLAVDTAPLESIAAARLAANVGAGFRLVSGSSEIKVDPAVVDGAAITFPVRATAREVAVLDPDSIAAEIRGLPLADAQAILDTYGESRLSVWPEWVTTIPTMDGRLILTVDGPTP